MYYYSVLAASGNVTSSNTPKIHSTPTNKKLTQGNEINLKLLDHLKNKHLQLAVQ
jgi:hypothetical protein